MTTKAETLPATQEYFLRAMATNYAGGHCWDHLDEQTCVMAADEIKALRAGLSPSIEGQASSPQQVQEACAKVADDFAAPGRFEVSDQWKEGMSPSDVYETAAIDVGGWIATAIRALILPAIEGQAERKMVPEITFDPTNHHNALKCPYCNPDGLQFVKVKVRERKPFVIEDDSPAIEGQAGDLRNAMQDHLGEQSDPVREALRRMVAEFGGYHYRNCPADKFPGSGPCDCFAGALLIRANAVLASVSPQDRAAGELVGWRYARKSWNGKLWRRVDVKPDFETPEDWILEPLYAIPNVSADRAADTLTDALVRVIDGWRATHPDLSYFETVTVIEGIGRTLHNLHADATISGNERASEGGK